MAKKSTKGPSQKDLDQVARALQILFATDFISKKRLYWENFVRGLTFSIGGIIGATIGIATIIWILSFFRTLPLIGPLVKNAQHTIQNTPSK